MRSVRVCAGGLVASFLVAAAAFAAPVKPVFESPVVTSSTAGQAVNIDVDIAGAKELYLVVQDGDDGFGCDWANWVEPRLVTASGEKKLTELKWKSASAEFGEPHVNKNVRGETMRVLDKEIENGIGTHAYSVIAYDLPEGVQRFKARGALDKGGVTQGCGSTVKFLVYTQAPPKVLVAKAPQVAGGADQHDPEKAVSQLDVAEGCEATLFASEPILKSVTNLDIDSRGRIWVCDVMNYRGHNGSRPEGDRILILEDTNGDGKADKHTVFYQNRDVDSAMGICVLGNKCIVSGTPNIWMFTFDENDKIVKKEALFTKTGQPQHDHSNHSFLFGPDGKLYWNVGNEGHAVYDKDGKIVTDTSGREVKDNGKPYFGGMPFRCNMDGSEFEVLGHNFRNNYETTVDSFGTLWQSDNDDDGNRGVRINYVMEHGNFGYRDEITGAGWNSPRTNLETEIPLRHWHLNDPGVVPNFVQTGAGSPTGICVYEGRLLPKVFWDQVLHCDAGPSVCRAYPATKEGAGYKGETVNVLQGARNNWFRPADVCVAPDGSIFVTDWYDPGVGGHGQRDTANGRIFRVAPPGSKYNVAKVDTSTIEGAIAALKNPNLATRYLGWTALAAFGDKAEPALTKLFGSENPRDRARALFLLARLDAKASAHLEAALKDADSDVRLTTLRAARAVKIDVIPYIAKLMKDESPQVRRECALALFESKSAEAPKLWAELAAQHNGQDRWYLEALGIGASGQWDAYLDAFLARVNGKLDSPGAREVVWRSRAAKTPGLLAKIIADPALPSTEVPKYLRAFDFQPAGESKEAALVEAAFGPSADAERQKVASTEALARLKGFDVNQNAQHKAALNKALDGMKGTPQFVTLVEKFSLADRYADVLAAAQANSENELGAQAIKLLVSRGQFDLLKQGLADKNLGNAVATARLLATSTDAKVEPLLLATLKDNAQPEAIRAAAARGLGQFKSAAAELIKFAEAGSLGGSLKEAVAAALHSSPSEDARTTGAKLFPAPPAKEGKPLPAIDQLAKLKGDREKGKALFATAATCAKCHKVNNQGAEVGPDLSGIGIKLSRPALFESILFPSASISHNYATTSLVLESGAVVTGIVTSETAEGITVKAIDVPPRTFKPAEIESRKLQTISLMPADLSKTLTQEELVDVVEYLTTLKQK